MLAIISCGYSQPACTLLGRLRGIMRNLRNLNTFIAVITPPFFYADTFDTSLLLIVCALRWYVKSLYRHFFLEDTSKNVRVTKKIALPNLWQK